MWTQEEEEREIDIISIQKQLKQKEDIEIKKSIKDNNKNYKNYNSIDITTKINMNSSIDNEIGIGGGSPSIYNEGGGSLYYSDLPVRSHILKDKYKFYGRKVTFYLFLAYFVTAITMFPFLMTNLTFWAWLIHTLYWELDLTSNKHNIFIKIIHPISFVLSYVVFITSVILLIILNPEFISTRAKAENHSIGFAWALNILIHWVPPIILTIDLFLHKDHIKKRHRIFLSKRQNNAKTWIKDCIKCIWVIVGPMLVVAAWFGAGFTISGVYGVTNYSLKWLIPSMCGVDVLVAIFFLFMVRKKSDSYIRLNN